MARTLSEALLVDLPVMANMVLRRRIPAVAPALRHKKWNLLALALFLVGWMQVATIAPAQTEEKAPPSLPTKASKVKEYPDFDYKYDRKREREVFGQRKRKKTSLDAEEVDRLAPAARNASALSPRSKGRRKNVLNGVELSDHHADFDVVGGADLYRHSDPVGHDEFLADEAKVVEGAGDGGEPVQLSEAEQVEGDAVMRKEAFNLVASDKMSLHRLVPDTRDPRCKAVKYDEELPTASVVIIFTNEAWTPLLRTVWSVLDKTPPELLHEIILVDDFSDKSYLKGKLERYIQKKFPSKVRLKRLHKRSGLIRARLTGARLATGDALLFLDSHCECGDDWLQPLLQRIKDEPRSFVVPIIDVIDDRTMEYYHGNGVYFQIGGFTWNGHFNWIDIPEHEHERKANDPVAPTRTPTMAGGLFAVDRNWFWEIGSYDEEMDVWGGENLEMSFRVWQCGGVLETIPCSRVGHIFRSFHPYTFPGNKDTHGINTARTVEVWMDDYKRLFYMHRPDLLSVDIGSVEARERFKAERGCRPFSWYLRNVFPQKFVPDDPEHALAYGRLRNPTSNACLDTLQNDDKDSYDLGVYPCHESAAASQFFSYSRAAKEIRREDACAEVAEEAGLRPASSKEPVKMVPCNGGQEWVHSSKGRMIHKASNKCLEVMVSGGQESLVVAPCKAVDTQVWFYDNYFGKDN